MSATTAANTVSVASGATALVNVKFTAAASAAQMAVADKANGAQHVRDLSQIRTHTLRVPQAALSGVLTALHHSLGVERVNAAVQLGAAGSPNDPDYPQQWALPQIGWDQAYGSVAISGSATIAVLDTGVDASHSDLAGRVVAGQSEVGGDPNADPNGHGTALAGIAAATTNNGTGMAGVAWAGTSVSSVQVLGADGTGYDSDVVAGVLWAADHGASVLLMGFSSATYSATLADALDYAWGKGVVLVAATGNDGSSTTSYPAGMPHVLGVAATDAQDHVATFSNTGSAAVAAPGVNVLTTQPGGGYGAVSGTSAASAHVAGLAALLVASGHSASLTHDQIVGTTDPVSGTATFGRLDVARALGAPVTPLPTATAGASPTPDGSPTYIAAATSTNLTTVEVTNLSPDSAPPGATKVAVLSFTVHTGSLGTEKFQQVKPTFTGSATTADVQTVYLYQEAGAVAGSSFDPATDTFRASASPVACGTQLTLNPADFTLPPNSDVKFYLVVDLKTTATLGRTVDFRVNANAATFQSGTWPPTAESTTSTSCTVAANTWNPAGVTTIANPTPTPTATATATSTPMATATATAIASPTATGTPRVCQPVTTPDAWGRPWTSTCYGVLR